MHFDRADGFNPGTTMRSPMRLFLLTILGFCALAAVPASASAHDLLDNLILDRVDSNDAVWRLSEFVQTQDGPEPTTPRPVYIQFGFMSCAPCHVLARQASDQLDGHAELIYIHLDDVELRAQSLPLNQLWETLYYFMEEEEPYQPFTGMRRGNVQLMESLCGTTAAPDALLILPDGSYEILTSIEDADAMFAAYLESIAAL